MACTLSSTLALGSFSRPCPETPDLAPQLPLALQLPTFPRNFGLYAERGRVSYATCFSITAQTNVMIALRAWTPTDHHRRLELLRNAYGTLAPHLRHQLMILLWKWPISSGGKGC
jgi:hypothetical protein